MNDNLIFSENLKHHEVAGCKKGNAERPNIAADQQCGLYV